MKEKTLQNLNVLVVGLRNQVLFDEQVKTSLAAWLKNPDHDIADILLELGFLQQKSDIGTANFDASEVGLTKTHQSFAGLDIDGDDDHKLDVGSFIRSLPAIEERYAIGEFIGSGGTSEVFAAFDTELERNVAIKILKKEYESRSAIQRFLNEARVAALVEHPNIPSVYSVGTKDNGLPSIAMQLLSESTLAEQVQPASGTQEYVADFDGLVETMKAVCLAAHHAHESGFVHRDIKPANIFLGSHGEVHLGDWGLACKIEKIGEQKRDSKTVSGTLPFVCPERLKGISTANPVTDVYSLGVTLYFGLTGRLPFSGSDTEKLKEDILAGKYDRPRKFNSKIPKSLEAICVKAMAWHPKHRYQSALMLKEEFDALQNGRALKAPEPVFSGIWRYMRNNIQMVTAVVLLSAIGLGAWLYFSEQNRREVNKANVLATQEKSRAIQSIKDSQDIVDEFLIETSQGKDALVGIPGTRRLRKSLLQKAKDYYSNFIEANSDLVPVNRVLNARYQLALVQLETGEITRAEEALVDCIATIKEILSDRPDDINYREQLAHFQHSLAGVLASKGDYVGSVSAARKAVDIWHSIGTDSTLANFKETLLSSRSVVTSGLIELGKFDDALPLVQELNSEIESIPTPDRSFELLIVQASVQHDLALIFAEKKEIEASLKMWQKCEDSRILLTSERPNDSQTLHELAVARHNHGRLLCNTGNLDDGVAKIQQALSSMEALVDSNPNHSEFLSTLLSIRSNLGVMFLRQKKNKAALGEADAVIAMATKSNVEETMNAQLVSTAARSYLLKTSIYTYQGDFKSASANSKKGITFLYKQLEQPSYTPQVLQLSYLATSVHLDLVTNQKDFTEVNRIAALANDLIKRKGLFDFLDLVGGELAEHISMVVEDNTISSEAVARLDELAELYALSFQKLKKEDGLLNEWKSLGKAFTILVGSGQFGDFLVRSKTVDEKLANLKSTLDKKDFEYLQAGWRDNQAYCFDRYARKLATSKNDQFRNGKLAIEIAEKACKASHWKKAGYVMTLAAAHAEFGDFENAMTYLQKAEALGDADIINKIEAFGELFEKGLPIRED